MQSAIPALIISGFLGAGKTTLVAHLLKAAQAEGVRLAIVSNEFGDTGIDRALLDNGEEGFVELDGGCVCCRLSDALSETLEMILTTVKPDRLVLETSGVALPGEVVVQFWRPPIDALVSEEVVVVVVDAERMVSDEPLSDTYVEQLEAADLVLLNKRDLVDAAALELARARLHEMTNGRPIIDAEHAQVLPELLFPPDPSDARQARRDPKATMHPHVHEAFNTRELSFPGVVDAEDVVARVQLEGALRAKGFIRTTQGVRVIQGVGERVQVDIPSVPVAEDLVGRVVIIYRERPLA